MYALEKKASTLAKDYPDVKKVALSHSGGLDSAVIGSLLLSQGFGVHPVVVNIGQHSDFSMIEKNAKAMFGECHIVDGRGAFLHNVERAIKTNFLSEGSASTGGFSRPAIAFCLADTARKIGCQAIAHGSSGMGNDHLIMENSLRVLAPEMRIMAIVRDLDLRRDEELSYAKKHKLMTNLERARDYSVDENMFVRTIRPGIAVDPFMSIPEDYYKWTAARENAPSKSAKVELEFSAGIAVSAAVEGKKAKGTGNILRLLNEVGGKHGIGRFDSITEKTVGLKVREAYECPAAAILASAHRELEEITLTTRELEVKRYADAAWNRIVREGGWYTRLRRSLDAFIDETQRPVDGLVSLSIYRGSVRVLGRKSRHALYDARLSGRNSQGVFSQKEARAYAKLHGLQEVIAYLTDVEKP